MLSPEALVIQNEEGDIEFHASYRNTHGTGYDLEVSNPVPGMVDILITQVVGHEVPDEPSVSLSLPPEAAAALMRALSGGVHAAYLVQKQKGYN